MEENENIIEELKKIYPVKDKPKKKFVYLDKYEAYKDNTDGRLHILERSLNICYVGIGVLAFWLLLITLNK
jgi:hypothetical protein